VKHNGNIVQFPGQRWPASSPDPELSIPEVLEALAADIRKDKYAPAALIIGMVHPQSDGTIEYPYITVNLSPLEVSGLLAKLLKELT